jgi:hydrogenase-4 component E
MNDSSTWSDLINILLVLVLATVVLVITQRTLRSLISIYITQSALLAVMAAILYFKTNDVALPFIAGLTIASKVMLIPWLLRRIQDSLHILRDLEFRYLTPITSVGLSAIIILVVWIAMPDSLRHLWTDRQVYLSAVIGISIVLTGMIVVFSRRKIVTKIIGYLTMENGVLLFGMFVAKLPLIIEALIIIDLIILVVLAIILAFGIDSSIDAFHDQLNDLENLRLKRTHKK